MGCTQHLCKHTNQCFQAHAQVQGGPQGTGAWPSGDRQLLETGQEHNGPQVERSQRNKRKSRAEAGCIHRLRRAVPASLQRVLTYLCLVWFGLVF